VEPDRFVDRVFKRVPDGPVSDFFFEHWSHEGKPTEEGIGILAVPGADPERVLACVFDVDHYAENIPHVDECRAIADPSYDPPTVRFYQRIRIPLIGKVHHELVLERLGSLRGYEVACWHMLARETEALSSRAAIRSHYSDGVWIAAAGVVGYGLSSAPRREDTGFLKWKALTVGADAAAPRVIRDNIEGMAGWAAR
jgi:hypothetical protein